jgi:uncharacterized protein (DUF2267 family)
VSYYRPRSKVTGTIGRTNSGPVLPVVMLENIRDWLTPSQARALAARLNRASDVAIEKYSAYRAKKARAKREKGEGK